MIPHEVVQPVSLADLIGEFEVATGYIFSRDKVEQILAEERLHLGGWAGEQEGQKARRKQKKQVNMILRQLGYTIEVLVVKVDEGHGSIVVYFR